MLPPPEQLLFQSVLLFTAIHGYFKRVLRDTVSSPISLQEGRTFKVFFEPAGLSWSQFKSIASSAIEFVSFDNGDLISDEEDSDFLYGLYSGEAEIKSTAFTLKATRGSCAFRHSEGIFESCKMGLWGDVEFSRMVRGQGSQLPKSSLHAGPAGATMARIHAPTLQKMMIEDPVLASSMESLPFRSIQSKAFVHSTDIV
jgi:hypothetical protein